MCNRKCYTGDGHMCAQCFPSDAAVSVQRLDGTVTTRSMEQLHVGDAVLTQEGFSKIFAFMDHASEAKAEYVQFETASGHELSLTADHIVYAHADQIPVLAGSIVIGDTLWSMAGTSDDLFTSSKVVSVQRGLEHGMHAPLTEQGSVVVNGILSSSYAKVNSLSWGSQILVSGHDLNRYMHEPLRLACGLLPALCGPKWHSIEGRHAWTEFILTKFSWLQAINHDYSDIRSALINDPSVFSWIASFAQLSAALLLAMLFGPTSRLLLMVIAVVTYALMRRMGARAGK